MLWEHFSSESKVAWNSSRVHERAVAASPAQFRASRVLLQHDVHVYL